MSELKPNTECRICGKLYYSCKTCKDTNHWKSVACCPKHFAEYVELVNNSRNENIAETSIKVSPTDEVTEKHINKKHTKISEKAK